MKRKVGKLGNLGRTVGWIHKVALVERSRVHNLKKGVGCTLT